MTKSKVFMESFMEKINTDKPEINSQNNEECELTEGFVNKQNNLYTKAIKSSIIKNIK